MMLDDPFGDAAARAAALGACPINLLEEFYTEHWDRDSLCSGFDCGDCVATPEDFGYEHWWRPGDQDEEPPILTIEPGGFEIDF